MIVARGTEGSDTMLLLGLSRENVNRLIDGKPIHVRSGTHPGIPAGLSIVICFGETEQDLHDELKAGGVLDGVPVHKDPRL